MKKQLLACCLFLALQLHAQQPQLVYDFNKGIFIDNDYAQNGKPKPFATGSFAVLKIINVNTFRWKVEIEGRSINYITPIPSELQSLFRLPDQTANKQKTENALGEIDNSTTLMSGVAASVKKNALPNSAEAKTLDKSMTALVEACKEYLDLAKKMANIKFTRVQLINLVKQKWESYDIMHGKLPANLPVTDMRESYYAFVAYYAKAEAAYEKALQAAKQYKLATQANLNQKKAAAQEATDAKLAAVKTSKDATGEVSNAPAKKLASAKAKAADAEETSTAAIQKADEALKQQTDAEIADSKAAADAETIQAASEGIDHANDAITENNFLKLIEDVMVLQDAMENAGYFEVSSPPIQMNGDFVEFKIKTTPVQTSDLMPYESGKTFPLEVPVKGGLKVDFSVGPVFSFGSNARDEKYYIEPVPGMDSVTFLQRDNNNAISPGIAAMMHFYKRSGKSVAFGGMFGVGAGFQSINDASLSVYAGLSAVMGKQEKIMLSAGISYLSVQRLKNKEFVPDKRYATSKIDLGNLTEKIFKPSFFISISYNLTNRVEVK